MGARSNLHKKLFFKFINIHHLQLPGSYWKPANSYSGEAFLALVKATPFTKKTASDIRKVFERISDLINLTFVRIIKEVFEENVKTISKIGIIKLAI